MAHAGEVVQSLTACGWMKSIPERLRRRLIGKIPSAMDTTPPQHGIPSGPFILLLYAGPDNHDSLDVALQLRAPGLSPYLYAVDIHRDKKRHDMLEGNLYSHLLDCARRGQILAILGGPNCRTWSALLHRPMPDGSAGRPMRGRSEPSCWGLANLGPAEAAKTDSDSILALRMLHIYHSCRAAGYDPAFLLEHPADPALHPHQASDSDCSTLWETQVMKDTVLEHDLLLTTFPQGPMKEIAGPKWTTLAHRHMPTIRRLGKLTYDGPNKHYTAVPSKNTARWAWQLNVSISNSLATILPALPHWTNDHDSDRVVDTLAATSTQPTRNITVTIGHKTRPLRDGGGKPSPGRVHPAQRRWPLAALGASLTSGLSPQGSVSAELTPQVDDLLAGLCTSSPFPEHIHCNSAGIIARHTGTDLQVAEGQPFALGTLAALARQAGDPDHFFPLECTPGLPLGVTDPLPDTRHIWPSKQELTGVDPHETDLAPPHASPNYPSAEEHYEAIEATYREEAAMGMVAGPLTPDEAATICGCQPSDLCHGALAGKLEGRYGDKLRTIHDGTVSDVNPRIKANQQYKTTAPGLQDALTALLMCATTLTTVFKLDVSRAHRRMKIRRSDWRYQTAQTASGIWVNKVGTYGVASAQYHWGRMAALILRLLYYTFPTIIWAFVYVDDFLFILPKQGAAALAVQILLFLHAIGLPISWKKVAMGDPNTWLGYLLTTAPLRACLTPDKQTTIIATLAALRGSAHLTLTEVQQAAGRLNWATMIYPAMRPFLQPIYAWLHALIQRQGRQRTPVHARPTDHIRIVADFLDVMFRNLPPPSAPKGHCLPISAATDAGARPTPDGFEAYVGGWYGTANPTKADAHWFYTPITAGEHPWAYERGDPKLHIAAIELYGTLLLYRHISNQLAPGAQQGISMALALATDNKGNAYQVTNHKSKNHTAAAMLMELALTTHHVGTPLALAHKYREHNTWADQLTHADSTGFSGHLQFHPNQKQWYILDRIINSTHPPTARARRKARKS